MARITLDRVGHRYGHAPYALEPFDMVLEDGRSYALLGPSGCGKTTMLNIISGVVRPSEGRILLDDRDVTAVPISGRNVAQVFQFPVIYQSKSVYENLAFPLRCRRWPIARIKARVAEIADLLDLSGRLGKPAWQLTVDEKQLISLGRGLVRDDVAALLMDEPLTVIDPQMKFQLRRKLKAVSQKARHTVIYVTHDQNEAMTFADEILVMSAGKVVQRGTPQELFERPRTTYVGYFIGSPSMNVFDAEIGAGGVMIGGTPIAPGSALPSGLPTSGLRVGIRPEYVSLAQPEDSDTLAATVVGVQDHGSVRIVEVAIGTAKARLKLGRDIAPPSAQARIRLRRDKLCLFVDDHLVAVGI